MTIEKFIAYSMKIAFPLRKFNSSLKKFLSIISLPSKQPIISFLMKGNRQQFQKGKSSQASKASHSFFSLSLVISTNNNKKNTIRIQNFMYSSSSSYLHALTIHIPLFSMMLNGASKCRVKFKLQRFR
jgi:hypothetical protein